MIIEGVSYARYRVTFTLADGRRRRWLRWAPGALYLSEALKRELLDSGCQVRGRIYVRWDGKS